MQKKKKVVVPPKPRAPWGFHKLNGASTIFVRKDGSILCIKSRRTDIPPWEIPGGEIERRGTPDHTAVDEALEEAGALVDEGNLNLFACLVQRRPRVNAEGTLFLFVCYEFNARRLLKATDETVACKFISQKRVLQMLRKKDKYFSLGYARMLALYFAALLTGKKRCKRLIFRKVKFGRLSDPVIVPVERPFVV